VAELLTDSPADIIANLLVALGLGVAPSESVQVQADWTVQVSNEPESPDNVITVYDTQGHLDGVTTPDRMMNEHVGIQIRVRAQTHPIGWQKANQVAVALINQVNQAIVQGPSGDYYIIYSILQTGAINTLGKEVGKSRRRLFTYNAICAIGNQGTG
jgi:hypothetical protein